MAFGLWPVGLGRPEAGAVSRDGDAEVDGTGEDPVGHPADVVDDVLLVAVRSLRASSEPAGNAWSDVLGVQVSDAVDLAAVLTGAGGQRAGALAALERALRGHAGQGEGLLQGDEPFWVNSLRHAAAPSTSVGAAAQEGVKGEKRLTAWLASVGYCGRTTAHVLHTRLQSAPRGATGDIAQVHAATTAAYLAVLASLNSQISALADRIGEQLTLHPDGHIFTSLPRSGSVRAARPLAEIGDARGRFPTPDSLACLAGVAPSTRSSGKTTAVTFRWGADKQLRDALCDFAGDSRHANPWAADLYRRARARGHDHPHAVRILARPWAPVIWRCWHDGVDYDPINHRALQRILNQDQQAAA